MLGFYTGKPGSTIPRPNFWLMGLGIALVGSGCALMMMSLTTSAPFLAVLIGLGLLGIGVLLVVRDVHNLRWESYTWHQMYLQEQKKREQQTAQKS